MCEWRPDPEFSITKKEKTYKLSFIHINMVPVPTVFLSVHWGLESDRIPNSLSLLFSSLSQWKWLLRGWEDVRENTVLIKQRERERGSPAKLNENNRARGNTNWGSSQLYSAELCVIGIHDRVNVETCQEENWTGSTGICYLIWALETHRLKTVKWFDHIFRTASVHNFPLIDLFLNQPL